jgi:hypothetical protein
MVGHHADVRIVRLGLRRRQQNQAGVQPRGEMRSLDQFPADALPLKGSVHGQVGQIRACNS